MKITGGGMLSELSSAAAYLQDASIQAGTTDATRYVITLILNCETGNKKTDYGSEADGRDHGDCARGGDGVHDVRCSVSGKRCGSPRFA